MQSFVTPPGKVLIAFLWQPLFLPDGQHIYMAEVGFPDPLQGIEPRWCEDDLACYRSIARRPPAILDRGGQAVALLSEIGPRSVIKLSLVQSGSALVVRAVMVLELHTDNPFQLFELGG